MTSHQPDKCCFVVYRHEVDAQGSIEKLGGINVYVARPENDENENGIILFPDFMGYELINAKLIADQLAKNGYFTVIPDIWEGDNVPLGWTPTGAFQLGPWMQKHMPKRVVPIAEKVVRAIRDDIGVKKLGAVGYCLGAKYVCRFMAREKGIDAGFFAHPTAVTLEELTGVTCPLSIAADETDGLFPSPKRHETEEILKGMDVPYQMTLYSDVEHGFALKADFSQPLVKFAAETAFLQAVNWFDHFLKQK